MSSDAVVACRGALEDLPDAARGASRRSTRWTPSSPPGTVTAIVGASGSGKSTLLRAVAGLDRPTERLARRRRPRPRTGRPRESCAATAAEIVTYVSQKPADNFIPHLTLAEHATDEPELARQLLADVGLEHRLDSLPIELSGGEQARAAFALAVGRGTPLVVVDEPTAELDGESAHLLLEAVRRNTGAGVAFVVATHDPDVTAIADSVLRLERGRVVTEAEAIPADAAGAPAISATRRSCSRRARSRNPSPTAAATCTRCQTPRSRCDAASSACCSAARARASRRCSRCSPAGSSPTRARSVPTGPAASHTWAELGYLPQRFGLVPELSVRENVELPARLDRPPQPSCAGRIDELLDELGLDELAGRRPAETSIGQQQRTALARALVLQPTVLIADEPSSHQDAGWHDAVWELLARAAADGTAASSRRTRTRPPQPPPGSGASPTARPSPPERSEVREPAPEDACPPPCRADRLRPCCSHDGRTAQGNHFLSARLRA